MTETRLFVGNLPTDLSEEDLISEFQSYGKVLSIDIKSKQTPTNHSIGENARDNTENMNRINTFAFIRLIINDNDLQLCLREFREYEYYGRYLIVCVAKEHFLTKLQREREQNPSNERNTDSSIPPLKFTSSNISSRQTPIRTDCSDSLDALKEANQISDMTKIELLNCKNEINKQNKFILKTKADIKRKDALTLKVQVYENQQLIIKQALAVVDHSDNNKKIAFDYDDQNDGSNTNKKPKLFDFDENDDQYVLDTYDKDFSVKEQFQGLTGEKLMQLQSKFNNDDRFRLSNAFLGDANDNRDDKFKNIKNENDESAWQYQIIESITGKPLDQTTEINIKKKVQPMLRYDPTKESHTKYLNSSNTKHNDGNMNVTDHDVFKYNLNKNLKIHIDSNITSSIPNENVATREQFYKFSEHLSKTLNNSSKGFSLLSMFGSNGYGANGVNKAVPANNKLFTENNRQENFNFNTIDSIKSDINPFDYDNHDNVIMDNQSTEFTRNDSMPVNTTKLMSSKVIINKKIKHEHLFLNTDDDIRLKEGELFFICHLRQSKENLKDNNTMEDSMKLRKEELRKIIKKKIKRTARNTFSTGGKQFKTFRKVNIKGKK